MAQITIDGEKLRKRLLDIGVKPSQASVKIGFTANYWGKAMKSGVCSEVAALGLLREYGIDRRDYEAEEEKPVAMAQPEQPAAEQTALELPARDAQDLRAIVCEGVLDALAQIAANDDMQQALNRVIYCAVKGAIINANRLIKEGA